MDVYRTECRGIVKLFMAKHISFSECLTALDAVLATFIPKMTSDQLPELRAELLSNNAFVTREMELRGSKK